MTGAVSASSTRPSRRETNVPSSACRRLIAVGLGAALLVGCGGDSLGRRAISGTVTFDGAPLAEGNIGFQPIEGGITSGGTSIAAGKYALTRDSGLPVGKYRVTVNAAKPGTGGTPPEGAMPGDPLPVPVEMIPPEWNVNSQQTIEVKESGPYEFNFDIVTKK